MPAAAPPAWRCCRVTASACGSAAEPEVDPLQAQLDLATADAEMARAAAAAAAPPLVPALTQIAAERAEHAQALAEEIARAAGAPAPTDARSTTDHDHHGDRHRRTTTAA